MVNSTPMIAVVSLAALLMTGCSDAPPPEITVSDVTIETDPLRLVLAGDGFAVDRFVEVGVVGSVDLRRYYDPADGGTDVVWRVATRATSWDEAAQTLTLDNGVRLAIAVGEVAGTQTLVADASGVDGAVMLRWVWPRDAGEPIYGFGEQFDAADGNGTIREMQLRVDLASESSLNEIHVPIPLAQWPARRAGVFVDDDRPSAFDVGVARADAVLATVALSPTEDGVAPVTAHVYAVDSPLALSRRYAQLTALPALPPLWAFAPQQWRNEHRATGELLDDARTMRAEGVPGSVMWIDNPWQTAYNDFVFDETRFEDIGGALAELDALGYRVVVWSTPYVNRSGPTEADFAEARERGFLVTDDVGQPFVFPWQDGPGALVDFTADGATAWWQERIDRVLARGIAGFKLDFGEDLVPELSGSRTPFQLAGGDAQTLHARYSAGFHAAYLDALIAARGEGFLITRAGAPGEQAVNTAIWPGDLDSDFSRHGVDNGQGEINVGGLPAAIAGGLSLSVSGYPFYGSDIGGFREGTPSTECLIRWAQYASLGTIMQLGGGGRSHNPWDPELFDPIALSVYRTYARLHMDLVPYIYTLATRAATDGTPVVRPVRFVHPDAATDDASYTVGDDLFVAPVIEEGAVTRSVVLPPGTWVDWWTGAVSDGDGQREQVVGAPLEILPLWRRADRFVPMFAREADTLVEASDPTVRSYADPEFGRELALRITPLGGPAEVAVHDGASATGASDGERYTLTATPGATFDVFTFDLDGRGSPLGAVTSPGAVAIDGVAAPEVADEQTLQACPVPGCWLFEPGASRLRVRVHVDAPTAVVIEPATEPAIGAAR